MEDNRYPHGQKMYDLIKEVIDVTGPRLPAAKKKDKAQRSLQIKSRENSAPPPLQKNLRRLDTLA